MQTGDPNSDDELLLMSEVESLQSQLKKNGETINEKFENIFLQSLHDKPLPDRIRKWTNRRDYLRKMAQHTSSGGPAVSLDVDSTGLKADQHVVKEETKEQKERVKRRRIAGDEARQQKSVKAKYIYKKKSRWAAAGNVADSRRLRPHVRRLYSQRKKGVTERIDRKF